MTTFAALYPVAFWLKVLPLMGLWVLGVLGPLLLPAWTAWRKRLDRPVVFIILIASLVYGFILLVTLAVWLPVSAFVVGMAPTLKSNNLPYGSWLLLLYEIVQTWGSLLAPTVPAAASYVLSYSLAKRWNALVLAFQLPIMGNVNSDA
ncbi:MAG: hypothetical protein HY849_02305 [Nitrosomonadales bacterium]|nr:hypothetical protein [Nitrosomonadales bacterium]